MIRHPDQPGRRTPRIASAVCLAAVLLLPSCGRSTREATGASCLSNPELILPVSRQSQQDAATADLDCDGTADSVVFRAAGDERPRLQVTFSATHGSAQSPPLGDSDGYLFGGFADFDQNGFLDVVLVGSDESVAVVTSVLLLTQESLTFARFEPTPSTAYYDEIVSPECSLASVWPRGDPTNDGLVLVAAESEVTEEGPRLGCREVSWVRWIYREGRFQKLRS